MSHQYSKQIIIINSSNYQGDNRYVYRLPTAQNFTNCLVSLSNISMYNSSFNISNALNNDRYSIIWRNVQYDFVIPAGYYSYDDLSNRIAFDCASQNLYVLAGSDSGAGSGSQQIVNFFKISANSVRYKAQLTVFYIPTEQQATELDYEIPPNANWTWPLQAETPQIIFHSVSFLKLLGFPFNPSTSIFPPEKLTSNSETIPSPLVYLSSSYPQISPIFSYIICCSLVDNIYNNVPIVLHQLPLSASYGKIVVYNNSDDSNVLPIRSGFYSQIEITFLSNDYLPLQINDPDLMLTLAIHLPV